MTMHAKLVLVLAGSALAAAAPQAASAAELVTNGGFETGDFTGWTLTGNTGFTGVTTSPVYEGTYAAYFGQVGSTGTLSQLLDTVVGETYTISFALSNLGSTPNSFAASFGDSPLLTFTNLGPLPYVLYTFSAVATSTSTPITFTFRQDPSFWVLDAVSVDGVLVPEPATWAMMIGGMGLAGGALRRRHAVRTTVSFA